MLFLEECFEGQKTHNNSQDPLKKSMTAAIYEYVVRSSHLWQNASILQGSRLGLKWQMGRASLSAVSFLSLSIIYKSWLFFPSLCLPVPQRWIWNQTISGWKWHAFAKCLPFQAIRTILCSFTSLNCSKWEAGSCCRVSLYGKTTEAVWFCTRMIEKLSPEKWRSSWESKSNMADAVLGCGWCEIRQL